MRITLFVVVLFAVVVNLSAQSRYAFEKCYNVIDTTSAEGSLSLSVVNKNFFKNDEYFGEYVEGYTLPGYSIRPTLLYKIAHNVSLEAGAELLQYGGTDSYDRVVPYLVAQWQVNNMVRLSMGCIEGAGRSGLSEAIYDPEHQLNMLPETGAQVDVDGENLDFRLWMNWQQFIKRNDTIPEKFMAGIALDYNPISTNSSWDVSLPLRLTVSHIGGQISNYPERMQSLANGSLSVKVGRKYTSSFVKRVGLDLTGLFFYTMSGSDVRPFADGWGLYPKVELQTDIFDFSVGYYTAQNYFALHGNPLFMSLSNFQEYYSKERSMLTFEGHINHQIHRHVRFTLGAKGYFDTDASEMEYWYGFALVITPQWSLIKR